MNIVFDHREKEADNIYTFHFNLKGSFDYLAGQYVEVSMPGEINVTINGDRWYTLSSSPSEKFISFTTRFDKVISDFKNRLLKLQKGDEITISEPIGDFVLPIDKTLPLVFISGGIGITPVRSIIKYLLDKNEDRKVTLHYLAKNSDSLIFSELFKQYNMQFQTIITSEYKLDIEALVNNLWKNNPESLFFVSGPQTMVENYVDVISSKFDDAQIVMDYFPGYSSI
jgi:ferredoxin-NADP reductase